MMIRVVIADDEALVHAGLRMILDAQDDIEVVGEAADGGEACRVVRDTAPDVALIDVRMHPMDGLEATRRLQPGRPGIARVLVLTTFDLDEYVFEAMRAGASRFLLKTTPPADLAAAVRAVARGEASLSPTITRRLIERFLQRAVAMPPAAATRLQRLTERERDVLGLVARGLSNSEIAASLFLSEATVKTHVNHLLAKLEVRDRVQAVVFAYESGFVASS
ncbi:MAG: response regulator [Nitriliruptorales bacterium]|nr:response regulator [Nitriliruptorales bacterium]